MKKLTILTLTLLLTALAQLTAQLPQSDSPIVRLIYFRPSDRPIQPDINTLMDSVIKDVQRFYAAQMEQHGYGRKTFQFEADANGNAVVHHVNGQFNDAYYQDALLSKVAEEIRAQVPTERDIYLVALDSSQRQYCGVASGGMAFMRAPGACVRPWVAAHELGHTFGLLHDARDSGHVMFFHQAAESFDAKSLSDCTAEWLDVHPAFNAGHSAVNNEPATIEMLAPSLTSPNTVRLRFEVTDLDGLHQAQLLIGKGRNTEATLTTCKQFDGNPSGSFEFVTTGFPPQGNANLLVIDMQGNTNSRYFPIDITPLLPPAQVVTIPDANLTVAIREALDLGPGIPITTHAMLNLTGLEAYNSEIKDITGLEHAHNLRSLDIGAWEVNGEWVNSNVITDLSPLSDLTNLVRLSLGKNYIWTLDFLRELPPLAPVSIPDPNLAAAIREELLLTSNEPVTTYSILDLVKLEAPNAGIKSLTGLEHAVNLIEVDLGNVVISDLSPLSDLTNLEVLSVKNFTLNRDFLRELPPLASIPDPNLAAAIREELLLTSNEPVTTHSVLGLIELDARNRGIKSLTGLEHAANLKEVDLGGEYISPSGSEGYLNSNAISDFSPLEKLTNLEELDLTGMSGLRDVSALARLTNLKTLHLWGSDVSDVSALAHLTNLKRLSLGPDVSDVSALAHLTNLERLGIDSTGFSDVSALASLTNLERLSLHGTGFSDVSALANLTNLKTLRLDSTDVSDVSALAHLTNLERLEIEHTDVSDVSALAHLTNLKRLNLWGSDVSDVSALAHLTNLTWLDLRYTTGVSDVSALASLTNLDTLHLYGTGVSDVSPLLGMSQLRWVDLRNCPLSYASIHTHIPALQAKGIEVEFYNVARPALLKVSGDRQEGEPGAMLKTAFVVEAMDEHGKPIVGQTVRFSVLEGEGTLSAKTVETDARGKARVTLTLGWYPGVNKVKASSEGIQSWVLFTAVGREEAPELVADVNGDGIVNIQDLVLVSGQFGKTGKNSADVNGDGVVNIQDLVLVASAFGEGAAAPSARAVSRARLTVSDVEGWLIEARAVSSVGQDRQILTSFSPQTHILSGSGSGDPELQRGSASRPGGLSYLRGLAVLEQLLASLMPKETALLANYPNPFNPETWIPYQLANPAEVTVTIYAANGAVVRTLDLGHRRAGSYASRHRAAYWDGRNAHGEPVASGVYFYTLQAGDYTATQKMVIRK